MQKIQISIPTNDYEIDEMMIVRTEAAIEAYSKPDLSDIHEISGYYSISGKKIANSIRTHRHKALCAKIGTLIAGMCVWTEIDENKATIDYLYILPEFQSRTIGSLLLETALDCIGTNRSVQLSTQNAKKFYEKKGFVGTNRLVTDGFTTEEIMIKPAQDHI